MKLDLARINQERERRGQPPLPLRGGAGRPPKPRPPKAELFRLYTIQGLSLRGLVRALGLSKDILHRTLKEYRIKRRPASRTRTSKLAVYRPSDLRRRVETDGLRATARSLGISAPGLVDYLARHGHEK